MVRNVTFPENFAYVLNEWIHLGTADNLQSSFQLQVKDQL